MKEEDFKDMEIEDFTESVFSPIKELDFTKKHFVSLFRIRK